MRQQRANGSRFDPIRRVARGRICSSEGEARSGGRRDEQGLRKCLAGPWRHRRSSPIPLVVARRPTQDQVRDAIDERLASPRLQLADLAEVFGCSPSTIQRACQGGFGVLLARRRTLGAARNLTGGATVSETAGAVGVSADHLTKLFLKEYGVRPGDLRRAIQGAGQVRRWKKLELPAPGSPWYYEQRWKWKAIERRFARLQADVTAGTDLQRWLDDASRRVARPDYRTRARSHRRHDAYNRYWTGRRKRRFARHRRNHARRRLL